MRSWKLLDLKGLVCGRSDSRGFRVSHPGHKVLSPKPDMSLYHVSSGSCRQWGFPKTLLCVCVKIKTCIVYFEV